MKLVYFENGIIPKKSSQVEVFDNELAKIVKAMFDVVYKYKGIGLASIQIGVPKRIIVVKIDGKKLIAINPEIVEKSNEVSEYEEGNLSILGKRVKITRPSEIKIKYQDLRGKWQELKSDGLLATCIQHEMEQMDGISILQR
ncbi:MAG: peptide deformylase [Rickettsiales bacterium]|jgi:peptide deformylase|nr:peptide deformylase [Rickettsiales bacterium]